MQFNQINKNKGDVNNNVVADGNLVQSVGDNNKVQGSAPKEPIWSMVWKWIVAWWKGKGKSA